MTLDERRNRIAALREQLRVLTAPITEELHRLEQTCPHYIVCTACGEQSSDEHCARSRWGHSGSYCTVCKQHFSWYCPASPDHACHYYSGPAAGGGRQVALFNEVMYELPAEYDGRWETEDDCIFCHQPEERK